jgi:hypothetical protein
MLEGDESLMIYFPGYINPLVLTSHRYFFVLPVALGAIKYLSLDRSIIRSNP